MMTTTNQGDKGILQHHKTTNMDFSDNNPIQSQFQSLLYHKVNKGENTEPSKNSQTFKKSAHWLLLLVSAEPS